MLLEPETKATLLSCFLLKGALRLSLETNGPPSHTSSREFAVLEESRFLFTKSHDTTSGLIRFGNQSIPYVKDQFYIEVVGVDMEDVVNLFFQCHGASPTRKLLLTINCWQIKSSRLSSKRFREGVQVNVAGLHTTATLVNWLKRSIRNDQQQRRYIVVDSWSR